MAYGARLESVLSESSQGFESPILRVIRKTPFMGVFLIFAPSSENRVRWAHTAERSTASLVAVGTDGAN